MAGRPSMLPLMNSDEVKQQILDKVMEGLSDYDIYTQMHVGYRTFKKWKEQNIEDYNNARDVRHKRMLALAEGALVSKLQTRVIKETETKTDADGNVLYTITKEKEKEPDTLASMFVAKAVNPELWNPAEWKKLQNEEVGAREIKHAIEQLNDYSVRDVTPPPVEIEAPKEY